LVKLQTAPPGERQVDSVQMVFVLEKEGKLKETASMDEYMKLSKDGWMYKDRKDSVIIKAWKSKLHDFDFQKRPDSEVSIKDSLLYKPGYKVLIVSVDLKKSRKGAWKEIAELTKACIENKVDIYAATSTEYSEADSFVMAKQLPFKFNTADNTFLKTMMRSNPGVLIFKDGRIIEKTSSRGIPNGKDLLRLMKKYK
jgi:hypothetical protein